MYLIELYEAYVAVHHSDGYDPDTGAADVAVLRQNADGISFKYAVASGTSSVQLSSSRLCFPQ